MRRHPLRSNAVRRRGSLPVLYDALHELASMRASVAELHDDLTDPDAQRLLGRIGLVEAAALGLLAAAEQKTGVLAH